MAQRGPLPTPTEQQTAQLNRDLVNLIEEEARKKSELHGHLAELKRTIDTEKMYSDELKSTILLHVRKLKECKQIIVKVQAGIAAAKVAQPSASSSREFDLLKENYNLLRLKMDDELRERKRLANSIRLENQTLEKFKSDLKKLPIREQQKFQALLNIKTQDTDAIIAVSNRNKQVQEGVDLSYTTCISEYGALLAQVSEKKDSDFRRGSDSSISGPEMSLQGSRRPSDSSPSPGHSRDSSRGSPPKQTRSLPPSPQLAALGPPGSGPSQNPSAMFGQSQRTGTIRLGEGKASEQKKRSKCMLG